MCLILMFNFIRLLLIFIMVCFFGFSLECVVEVGCVVMLCELFRFGVRENRFSVFRNFWLVVSLFLSWKVMMLLLVSICFLVILICGWLFRNGYFIYLIVGCFLSWCVIFRVCLECCIIWRLSVFSDLEKIYVLKGFIVGLECFVNVFILVMILFDERINLFSVWFWLLMYFVVEWMLMLVLNFNGCWRIGVVK